VSAELGALDARSWAEVTLRRASVAMLWEDHRRAIGSSCERAYAQSETSGRCARIAERQMRTEALMLREQMITLLQTSVVFPAADERRQPGRRGLCVAAGQQIRSVAAEFQVRDRAQPGRHAAAGRLI
jgi:hypothetical protein